MLFEDLDFALGLAEELAHLIDAPIVVGIFECASHIFVDAHIVRHITEFVVVFVAEATGRRYFGVHMVGTIHHRFVEFFGIFTAHKTFENTVSHHRGTVVAHHTSTVTRARPFGQKSALLIVVEPAFLHLGALGGIKQIDEREKASESIPETRTGVEITRSHATIAKRAVVNHIALGIYFVHLVREHESAEEAAVECAKLIHIIAFHIYHAEHLVPLGFRSGLNGIERARTNLLEVDFGLLHADKRRCHLGGNLFAAFGLECHGSAHMVVLEFALVGHYFIAAPHITFVERLVEHHHEVVGIVLAHAATVASVVAHNLVLLGNHLNPRTAVVGIDYHKRIVVGESETESGSTVGAGEFGGHIIVGKIYAIVVRSSHLSLMREPRGAAVFIYYKFTGFRHQRELTEIVNPWTRAVSLLEAAYLVGIVGIRPSVAVFACLRNPFVHTPRHTHGGCGIAV